MKIQPTQPNSISFGILQGYRQTPYGYYMWVYFKDYKIEIYDASKFKQKLIYVSNKNTLKWIKSKLKYIQDGIKRVTRSESSNTTMVRTTDN